MAEKTYSLGRREALEEIREKLLDGDPRDAHDFALSWIERQLAEETSPEPVKPLMRYLAIECPARCADHGCADHGCADHQKGTWRVSKTLPGHLADFQVRDALRSHAREFPKSGPYRAVEYTSMHDFVIIGVEG